MEANTAELTFEDLLATVDYEGDPTKAARAAIVQQQRRRRDAQEIHRSEIEAERVRERERAAAEKARADALQQVNLKQTRMLASSARRNDKLRRALTVVVLYLTAALVFVAAVALDVLTWPAAVVPALGMGGAPRWLYDWVRDPKERIFGLVLSAAGWAALAVLGQLLFS